MHPQKTLSAPAVGGGYVPYFYQWGLYRWQALPSASAPSAPANHAYARYDFTSDLTSPRTFYHAPSVEQIVQRGYLTVPRGDPATAIISDRRQTSWLGLDDLIGQIRQRYEIHEKNLHEMQLSKCAAANSLFSMEADRGGMPANSKERYALDKRLQEIYQEEREERVSLWQDVSRLRLSIAEAAQLYLSAYRKVRMLEDIQGDGR